MDQHTSERRFARCSQLWDAARGFRQFNTPEIDRADRRNRIKTNLINTAVNVTYYGGTIGAGVGFYSLLNDRNPAAIAVLVVFVLTVEGVLRTLLNEVLAAVTSDEDSDDATEAVSLAKTEEAAR